MLSPDTENRVQIKKVEPNLSRSYKTTFSRAMLSMPYGPKLGNVQIYVLHRNTLAQKKIDQVDPSPAKPLWTLITQST